MRRILCSAAVLMGVGVAWTPGAADAQVFAEETSVSFALGLSLWDGVGVGLAHRRISLATRTPARAATVFHGHGIGPQVDSYAGYDDFAPRCRWYGGDYLYGWIDRSDYSVHRCRRHPSRWGWAISLGYGWHGPGYHGPRFVWRDPFWSPWYAYDPWLAGGWFAFGWRSWGYVPTYARSFFAYPSLHYGYPLHYGLRARAFAPRHASAGRLGYGSGYARGYAPTATIRYKEDPRGTAVTRTARVAPRTAVARASNPPTAAASSVARRPGGGARARIARVTPRSPAAARPLRTEPSTDAAPPRVRTATPRVQPQPRTPVRARSDATSARPGSSMPRVRSRPATPRASTPPSLQPRTDAIPRARSRPSPTPRAQPRVTTAPARPRGSAPAGVRARPTPTPRAQPRAAAPPAVRARPAPTPSVRARPGPAARATARPTRPPRRRPGGP